MTKLMRISRRPWWMNSSGHENFGDVFFDSLLPEWRVTKGEEFTPSVDVYKKDGKVHFEAALPGYNKEEVDVSVENNILSISGEHSEEHEEDKKDYYFKETRCGSFSRNFRLPDGFDSKNIKAKFKDGMLLIEWPYKETQEPEKIEIR